ncbi:DUF2207 domain-containing protein [Candidatus Falkowbacteria bacterium]|nr:MAG: DUF2207 domain-containing protein [Candidatus Falkowbacteria bacterium]
MKKLFFVLISIIFLFPFSQVQAEGGYTVDSFDSAIKIQQDGSVEVTEIIDVAFFEESHGIYRYIPIVYKQENGDKQYTEIDVKFVSDGEKNVEYTTIYPQGKVEIKIGDPETLISGKKRYIINYTVRGVIKAYSNYDELYWNVTGNDWDVSMASVQAVVSITSGGFNQTACYFGPRGSKETCVEDRGNGEILYSSPRYLAPNEGLTIAVGFPKDTVPLITIPKPLTIDQPQVQKAVLFSFLLTFIPALIFLIRLWWRNGRDSYYNRKSLHDPDQQEVTMPLFGAHEPIGVEYEPPLNLRPAEIAVLVDEKSEARDISATIVDLAIKGYLTITDRNKDTKVSEPDYQLDRLEKSTDDLLPYEKLILESLFSEDKTIRLSELPQMPPVGLPALLYELSTSKRKDFLAQISAIKKSIYASVTEKKLFFANPDSIRKQYLVSAGTLTIIFGGLCIILFGMFLSSLGHSMVYWISLGFSLGAVLSIIILACLSSYMPKRTAYGREIYRQALGYKLFVSGTEKYRQPFFEKENIFMQVLPYAMVFGVTDRLVNAMKEMHIQPTIGSWYIGTAMFNVDSFTQGITSFSSEVSRSIATISSGSGSRGGGFSGGGFGGGGGGRW